MKNYRLLIAVTALIIVIGFGWYFNSSQREIIPADESLGNPGESTTSESAEYEPYREKLAEALALERSVSATDAEKASWSILKSEKYGFEFQYPEGYLVVGGKELDPTENSGAVFSYSLIQDNEDSRLFLSEERGDMEHPPHISMIVYPADNSRTDLTSLVPDIIISEDATIPGIYEKTIVSGYGAILYTNSTMYENDSVIVASGSYVYDFNVAFFEPEDIIRKDFYKSLSTVIFK